MSRADDTVAEQEHRRDADDAIEFYKSVSRELAAIEAALDDDDGEAQ